MNAVNLKPFDPKFKLVMVKLVHTFIWAVFASMIGFILYAGLANAITPFALACYAAVAVECAVVLAFGWRCPLTIIAYRYTSDRSDNFDIYLPEWLAKWNKVIFGSLYGVSLVILGYRVIA